MRQALDIVFDVANQVIYHDAQEGRPSSVTSATVYRWDVGDDDTAEAAIGAPAVETNPNTTIDAASGYGQADPRILNVAATTGMSAERTLLVTSADGLREWFDVLEVDSGNSVTAKHPLHNAYASADTVQSTRIQATIDSTWVADETNIIPVDELIGNPAYRVRWVYVVGGVTYVADTYFNLVRYPARHGVSPQDVEAMQPGWLDSLPSDHRNDQGRRLIDEAYRTVKIDLRQTDLRASAVADSEVIDELVRYKAIQLCERSRYLTGSSDADRVKTAEGWYMTRLDSLVRVVSRIPVRDVTGAATPIIATGITRR